MMLPEAIPSWTNRAAGPCVDKVAKALAGKSGARLQPTGAYAAKMLGPSDQVPAKVVFLTDGRSKRVRLGRD